MSQKSKAWTEPKTDSKGREWSRQCNAIAAPDKRSMDTEQHQSTRYSHGEQVRTEHQTQLPANCQRNKADTKSKTDSSGRDNGRQGNDIEEPHTVSMDTEDHENIRCSPGEEARTERQLQRSKEATIQTNIADSKSTTDSKGRDSGRQGNDVEETGTSSMDIDEYQNAPCNSDKLTQTEHQSSAEAMSQINKEETKSKTDSIGRERGRQCNNVKMTDIRTMDTDEHHNHPCRPDKQTQTPSKLFQTLLKPFKALSQRNEVKTTSKTDSRSSYNDRHGNDAEEKDTNSMDTEEHSNDRFHSREKVQIQYQIQRSIEASKQMLYGVFGNVISILEEYEQRELAKYRMEHNMPKSGIYIPDQRHKSFEDIRSIVETQLLLFETQTRACPPEALAEVHEELKRRTLASSAVRAEMGITEIQQTDYYLSKLYEILAKGATTHRQNERHEVTEEVMKESFQAIMYGDHDRAELDVQFKTNPDKKAVLPYTRNSEMLKDGASRISRAREDQELDGCLKADVNKFESYGPEDIK